MVQSMDIAKEIGARGVVFHTNVNPYLVSETYENVWLRLRSKSWKSYWTNTVI